ncbi:acyl-CoA thioesterase [Prochlorothrix hollandica]|uniref:1,4-dihydroxy-2-naphthoyl-CoA hydrolase n=1 Tax=Prochlorothrix hollandica PCC 9006 = CALU 1027 TaxID=317619 RepID=A0A0M2PND4_PROHO|nr:thioesterase family protein [Prochlorothrix hollandica]KKI98125.1 1,4-dihydroxy-2-naphthoyl-CoA hydrolase [Prochlorothrix hollandica PCC 9006 = CALU 1027]
MAFVYYRTVHFADTDAAGVVYFANLLSICHEAYEASLAATHIALPQFFRSQTVAIPIAHAAIDFFQPLTCGQTLGVHLVPQASAKPSEFVITYQIYGVTHPEAVDARDRPVATATTRHVCINPSLRHRQDLPAAMVHWLNTWAEGA